MNFALGICFLYLLVSLIVGILPGLRQKNTVSVFVAANHSMNAALLFFILGAAVLSSFTFLGTPSWAYERGAAAFYIIILTMIGIVPFYFLGSRARIVGARLGFLTQAEMLSYRFSSPMLSILLSTLTVLVLVPYLVLQMKGAGFIFNTISEGRIPIWMGAGLSYGIVTVYVLVSGVSGVGFTNALQGALMISVAVFLGWYFPTSLYGGVEEMFDAIIAAGRSDMLVAPGLAPGGEERWSWWAFSSWCIVSAIGMSSWPHIFMKAFAARSDREFRRTIVMYPVFQLVMIPILFIGYAAILTYPGVKPDTIVPFLLTQAGLPVLVVGLLSVGVLAASMSSGDTIMHAAASVFVRDGVLKVPGGRRVSDINEKRMILVMVVLLSSIAFYFAVISTLSLGAIIGIAFGGVAQIMPVLIATFYWRRATAAGVVSGLAAGILTNIFFWLYPAYKLIPVHEGILGLSANIALLVGVSYCTKPPKKQVIEQFFTDPNLT